MAGGHAGERRHDGSEDQRSEQDDWYSIESTLEFSTRLESRLPQEKILTISAQEYCFTMGKQLENYSPILIHTFYQGNLYGRNIDDIIQGTLGRAYRIKLRCTTNDMIHIINELRWLEYAIALVCPKETEVVVSYQNSIKRRTIFESGTALIPKRK